jgi:hypothetical protein
MISILHKAKQFLLVTVKLLIVTGALYYIYQQLQGDKSLNWNVVSNYLSLQSIAILVGFSAVNWILEIFKWQNLVSYFKEITFFEAAKQSLGSLTASIFTPNRIGEYGAKMLYYPKEKRKKIIFINFISNSTQMTVTCFFGVLGFIISKNQFQISIVYYLTVIIVLIGLSLLLRNIEIYGFSIQKLVAKLTKFPKKIMLSNFQLATLRYFVFSHQFYFLLVLFNCEISYPLALSTIFIMYLLASIVPTIHLMDVAIKSSVAVYLFGQMGVESWKIIAITSLMWIFNLVLPVFVGSYFVLRFKPNLKTKHIET